MPRELALVCGDGGIKGGFIAGAVTALLDSFPDDISQVKTIVASSASVGSMFYFISHGQKHPGRKIWLHDLASKEFIKYDSIRSIYADRPIYDIDHLVFKIFKEQNPLDIDAILNSPIEYYFPLQNYDTAEVEYFSNRPGSFVRDGRVVKVHDFRKYDIYELIRAANSAPFVYDKPARIGDTLYVDAATLDPFALDLPSLRGKKKIVVVSKSDFSFRKNLAYHASGFLWPLLVSPFKKQTFKAEIYRQYARKPALLRRLHEAAELAQSLNDLLYLVPIKKIGGNTDNSPASLKRNFEHGEEVVRKRSDEIRAFLSS